MTVEVGQLRRGWHASCETTKVRPATEVTPAMNRLLHGSLPFLSPRWCACVGVRPGCAAHRHDRLDIPLTTGQTDQGGEGMRFMGYTVYDALINWDLTSADKPSTLVPGLATEWSADPADRKKWTFKLRQGVKFHDGSEFTADAVVWNLDKLLKDSSPQFDRRQAAQGRSRIPAVAGYKVIDKLTVEITTATPDATLPYQLAWIMVFLAGPVRQVGKNWDEFAKARPAPARGNWKSSCPRERAELVPNKDYWDKTRIPKLDRLVLMPLRRRPHARRHCSPARWIGSRRPLRCRACAQGRRLQDRHQCVSAQLDLAPVVGGRLALERHQGAQGGEPRRRPRRHEGALGRPDGAGTRVHAARHQWFGNPSFKLKTDIAEAKKLMAEAGYGTIETAQDQDPDFGLGLGPDCCLCP